MIEISKRIKPDLLDSKEMTRILRGDHPNTYTFTKALAEQAVKENASDLPLSIFRPSIVVAAAKEPMPGWIDNLNGPTGNTMALLTFRTLTLAHFFGNQKLHN